MDRLDSNIHIWDGWVFTEYEKQSSHGDERRAYKLLQQRRNGEENLLEELEKLVPGCKYGHQELKFSDSTMQKIDLFIERIASQKRATKYLKRFLSNGLLKGEEALCWKVSVPPPELTVISSFNPHTPTAFIAMRDFSTQLSRFEKTLTPCWAAQFDQVDSVKLRWGQLLFSAAVFGGLLDSAAVLQLPFAKPNLRYHQDYIWIDFFTDEYPESVKADRGLRRWFLDPVSLVLLARIPSISERLQERVQLQTWLNEALYVFLFFLQTGASQIPVGATGVSSSIRDCYSTISTAYRIILPPYLVDYCAGHVVSSALPELSWLRVLFGKKQPLKETVEYPSEVIEERSLAERSRFSVQTSNKQKQQLFSNIKKALHRKQDAKEPSYKTIQNNFETLLLHAYPISPLLACLIEWFQLRHRKKDIRRSTAYQQLTSIGRELLTGIDDDSFLTMCADEFYDVYEDILQRTVNPQTRSSKADLIRRFHEFAAEKIGVPSITFRLEEDTFFALPDADILTEKEYQLFYEKLHAHSDDISAHYQLLIMMIGYRCGLRISEITHLKLEDIHYRWMDVIHIGEDSLESDFSECSVTLLVRPNSFNRLKTSNSKRQLPLNLLMSSVERVELLKFHQLQRCKVGAGQHDAFLFSNSSKNTEPLDFRSYQSQLHDIFRELTGNQNLRFHHLRHSFATHTLQAVSQHTQPLELADHIADSSTHISPTRKKLFEISGFLGHAHPGITLNHYTHNIDSILREELWIHSFEYRTAGLGAKKRLMLTRNTASNIKSLMGLSDSHFRKLNSLNSNIMGWLPKQLNIDKNKVSTEGWVDYPDINLDEISLKKRSLTELSFIELCDYLKKWRNKEGREVLNKYYYLNSEVVEEQATQLYNIFLSWQKKSNVRRKNKNLNISHQSIPRPPRSKKDISIAQYLFYKSMRGLSLSNIEKEVTIGLEYFFNNFKAWNQSIDARYDSKDIGKFRSFENLLDYSLPTDLVTVQKTRNPADSRFFNMGEIKIIRNDKGWSSDGAVFGLLLAYSLMRLKNIDTAPA